MNHVDRARGFTLIELVLAMGFVSVLLIAIAMTVMQIGNIYNKGLTLKEVNQAGRSLTKELQKSITQTEPFNIGVGVVGSRYITQAFGGRLCIGQYSYIWNYGSAIEIGDTSRLNLYSDSNNQIRFIKVSDPNSSYCTTSQKKVDSIGAVELLSVGEHDLAIHNFIISTLPSAGDTKTGQQLYSIKFVIGTNDQAALTITTNVAGDVVDVICKAPSQSGSDPVYCSVNEFNIVALAGNSVQ